MALTSGTGLARISHQAAQQTDTALAIWSRARMTQNTVCYSNMPITVQAGLGLHEILETMKDCNQLTFNLQTKKVTNMKTVLQSKDNAIY
ncbi:MAG: hypothetical protein WBO16_06510, partial [Gammaproteobacteria bacterium]